MVQAELDDGEALQARHFVALAAIHGNHDIDPDKGVVHHIQPGQTVYLTNKHDTWVPNEIEPFHAQVNRVFLAPAYAKFREEARQQRALASLESHLYRERMQKVGLDEYIRTYDDGVIV